MSDPTRLQGITPNSRTTAAPGDNHRAAPGRPQHNGASGSSDRREYVFAELLRMRQGLVPNAPACSQVPAVPAVPAIVSPAVDSVRFSAHAQTRLQSRRIQLDPGHLQRLDAAVQRAAGKGARDSLVLMDDLALVVSVTNRTVVTVVDKDNLKTNVFTNIDSAVIA